MPEAIISAKGTEAPTVRSGRFTRGDRLNVWMNGRHVGVFAALKNGVGFEYDPDAPRISFSLPKDGSWRKDAPENFLLNLLPESGAAKYAMMQSIGMTKSQLQKMLIL